MRKNIKKILFVCTGNSCRSIMAEAYMKKRAQEEKLDLEIGSAGTLGVDGLAPSNNTIEVLKKSGISAEAYRSTGLTGELIKWADIILVMTAEHKEKILELDKTAGEKTFYLLEFSDKTDVLSLADPVGYSLPVYEDCYALIKNAVEGFLKWLKK
ncbi:MAG: low molecular weight protein arginine phosphatase [Candidatus Omnitrophica bacterium]|nr:low molecular weight protein arginine phosphatase [Candidatus Omnitrophota bacterium]